MYNMQKIPAVKVIYKQISDWILLQGGQEVSDTNGKERKETEADDYNKVLAEFLKIASNAAKESEVTLIIAYQPSQYLNEDGDVAYSHSNKDIEIFEQECKKQDIIFCDLTDEFTELYDEKNVLAHGFSNTSVGSGHLNKYGHKVIAEAIVSKIQELEVD